MNDSNLTPSPNGDDRDVNGRFKSGNRGGPGNPYARQTARVRALICEAVTDDDLRVIVGKLVAMARAGDLSSIKELLDRVGGKVSQSDALERLENLEETAAELVETIRNKK